MFGVIGVGSGVVARTMLKMGKKGMIEVGLSPISLVVDVVLLLGETEILSDEEARTMCEIKCPK